MLLKKSKSRLSFFIILLVAFVDYLGIGLVYPIFAVLLFDINSGILPIDASAEYRGGILGILIALTPLSQFFCSPVLGAFSDKKGRRVALIIGIGIGCIGYLFAILGIFHHSITLLFLYRIFIGASDATASVAQATLADISTKKNKAKRFAYLSSSTGFGFTVGPFIGGVIADPTIVSWFSYSTPLIAAGVMSLINFFLVLWQFPETKKQTVDVKFDVMAGVRSLYKVFVIKNLMWLFIAGFALAFGWAFFNEFVPVLLRVRFEFTLSNIGEYYALTGACYGLGALLATRLVYKFKAEKIVIRSLLLASVAMVVFALTSRASYIWWSIPFMMVFLALAYPAATTIVSNRATDETQGEVLGVYQSVGAAAMGISPLLVGSAIGVYPELVAWGGAFFMILASCAFWLGRHSHIGHPK